jgi:hypothetical protein
MKCLLKSLSSLVVSIMSFGLVGCALPTVQDSLERFVGTKFTNPPRAEKRWVTAKDKDGREITAIHPSYYSIQGNRYKWVGQYDEPLYYRKELEGENTRYYISAWGSMYTDCRYSLLVSPDDIILSWRNEGPKHVSKCQHN